jgi:hypothetical protein
MRVTSNWVKTFKLFFNDLTSPPKILTKTFINPLEFLELLEDKRLSPKQSNLEDFYQESWEEDVWIHQ